MLTFLASAHQGKSTESVSQVLTFTGGGDPQWLENNQSNGHQGNLRLDVDSKLWEKAVNLSLCLIKPHVIKMHRHYHFQHQMEVSGQHHTTTSLPGERAPRTHYTESCVDCTTGLMQWRVGKSLATAKNEKPDSRLLKLQISKQKNTYIDLTGYQTPNTVIDSQVTTRSPLTGHYLKLACVLQVTYGFCRIRGVVSITRNKRLSK
jgi:hypothetical protein